MVSFLFVVSEPRILLHWDGRVSPREGRDNLTRCTKLIRWSIKHYIIVDIATNIKWTITKTNKNTNTNTQTPLTKHCSRLSRPNFPPPGYNHGSKVVLPPVRLVHLFFIQMSRPPPFAFSVTVIQLYFVGIWAVSAPVVFRRITCTSLLWRLIVAFRPGA